MRPFRSLEVFLVACLLVVSHTKKKKKSETAGKKKKKDKKRQASPIISFHSLSEVSATAVFLSFTSSLSFLFLSFSLSKHDLFSSLFSGPSSHSFPFLLFSFWAVVWAKTKQKKDTNRASSRRSSECTLHVARCVDQPGKPRALRGRPQAGARAERNKKERQDVAAKSC